MIIRRRYSSQHRETIRPGSKVYQCTTCRYKTAHEDRFQEHRIDHAVRIQQRLTTSIKRAAQGGDRWIKPRFTRKGTRVANQLTCSKCSFYCDTAVAYNTHIEMHGAKSIFTCCVCDYSSMTKNVVDFHEANHHLSESLSTLAKAKLGNDDTEMKKPVREVLRCCRCDFTAHTIVYFTKHWAQAHSSTSEDKAIAGELEMGLKQCSVA
ncbi:unnamed protein product [Gongylonema pulchrum]|uniref:C2H2-type domain-containing protein n=1 Tax=Gongylonema pulchrum TaxID=637853 RepID=A0A3P7QDL9_9BILA|nr:unnamed protein product [Gongylonema pulchrum]